MDRRDFLRNTCQACAAFAIAPAVLTLDGCASGAKMLAVENGVLNVPMDMMGDSNTAIVSGQGLANKLMVVKRPDGTYSALELICPHKGGPLNVSGDGLECDWHHSRFDYDGKVLNGPAKVNLQTYPVEADGKMMRVRVG